MVRGIYRALRVYNDLRAVSKGPQAVAKRLVRKWAYRTTTRLLRKAGL